MFRCDDIQARWLLPLALASLLSACGGASDSATDASTGSGASSSAAVSGASVSSAPAVVIQGVETPGTVAVVTANNAN